MQSNILENDPMTYDPTSSLPIAHRIRHPVRSIFVLLLGGAAGCASSEPAGFLEPEQAVLALATILESHDEAEFERIFGPGSLELFRSGDDVADRDGADRVKQMIDERVAFEYLDDDTAIALLGNEEWPFSIPLKREGDVWSYDTAAGREELVNRRIGRNELYTIATLREFVAAQREYFAESRDGNPPNYAKKLHSDEGTHNGLYWPVAEGESPSPMGEFVARAAGEGYETSDEGPTPFHGYQYKILTRQGAHAPGGERDYLDASGALTGGFAAVAWPAKPGNSGVMTFLVSDRGVIFEKDLGADTEAVVANMTAYDPDESWNPTVE